MAWNVWFVEVTVFSIEGNGSILRASVNDGNRTIGSILTYDKGGLIKKLTEIAEIFDEKLNVVDNAK